MHAPHNGGLDAPLFSPPPCFFLLFSPCQVVQADRRRGRGGSSRRPSPQAARSLSACAERHRPMLGHPCGRGGKRGRRGGMATGPAASKKTTTNKQTTREGTRTSPFPVIRRLGSCRELFTKLLLAPGTSASRARTAVRSLVCCQAQAHAPPPPKKSLYVRVCGRAHHQK